MATTYDVGDQTTLSATFTTVSTGAVVDPTTVTLKIKRPGGNETSHVYGTDVNVIKDSTGKYHYVLTLDASGDWYQRWVGTGAVVTAGEKVIRVQKSSFTVP